MISATDIVTPRFQLAVLAAIVCYSLQAAAMPAIISAADQEMSRRHSLIHHSAVESPALHATTHGTILQPPDSGPARITTQTEPPKHPVSVRTTPSPPHRTLIKHPVAIASITAPESLPQPSTSVVTSSIAAGQITQTTVDTGKSTTPTPTAPTIKATAATLPGITPAASATVTPTGSSPLAGAAGVHSTASAGHGSATVSGGSRSAANVLKNPAIMSLLQPPTPVVSTPPSPPPSSTPPPPSPPPSPSTGNVTLTWTANRESDLAGYKIYIGTASGTYSFPGSPFEAGTVTRYTVAGLPKGQTYVFAISAYDSTGNESGLSAEVSKSLY